MASTGRLWAMGVCWIVIAGLCAQVASAVDADPWIYRLADGPSPYQGRLEIRSRANASASWATICSSGFTATSGLVAARSLGLTFVSYATPSGTQPYAPAQAPIVGAPSCTAAAKQISLCTLQAVTTACATHQLDVWLTTTIGAAVPLRIVSATSGVGQVEVQNSAGQWARACAYPSSYEAVAACKQLGFNVAAARVLSFSQITAQASTSSVSVSVSAICAAGMPSWRNCTVTVSTYSGTCSNIFGFDCQVSGQWGYRLMNTRNVSDAHAGRLEVRKTPTGEWGTVCDDSFSTVDATVACKSVVSAAFEGQALYGSAYSYSALSAPTDTTILMDDVGCVSADSELGECNHISTHNCAHGEDVILGCFPDVPVADRRWEYRLSDHSSGLLEVRPSATSPWGTVCDDGFTAYDAVVACRSLGFNVSSAAFTTRSTRPSDITLQPVWMDNINCAATPLAQDLGECSFIFNGNDCSAHTEDILLDCAVAQREVRLGGESDSTRGQVQIRGNATSPWLPVCTSSVLNAIVFCRSVLGTQDVAAGITTVTLMSPSNTSDVLPSTPFPWFATCPSTVTGVHGCTLTRSSSACTTAYVTCSVMPASAEVDFEFRLTGGSTPTDGLLEARPSADAAWGTVCDDSFDYVDAVAACRSLGFRVNTAAFSSGRSTPLNAGPIWMTNLGCSTGATDVRQCSFTYASTSCSFHTEDVYLDCGTDLWEYRLLDETLTTTSAAVTRVGLFQFRVNATAQWQSACSSAFSSSDARVACRSLGFGSAATPSYTFASVPTTAGSGRLFYCGGSESVLGGCRSDISSCSTASRVRLSCSMPQANLKPWEYRLGSESFPGRGRLEVRPSPTSTWGTVCDDYFNTIAASAACRSLGLGSGAGATYFNSGVSPKGTGAIWMDNVQCGTADDTLTNCSFVYSGSDCSAHTEDIGVDCRVGSWEYRLSGGTATEGRLELRPNSTAAWGTVCSAGFSLVSANVACASLNQPSSAASFLKAADAPHVSRTASGAGPYVTRVACASISSEVLAQCGMNLVSSSASLQCAEATDAVVLRCDSAANYPVAGRQWEYRQLPSASSTVLPSPALVQVRPASTAPWGTICDDSFASNDAVTVCRALGFNGTSSPTWRTSLTVRPDAGPIWVDNLFCPYAARDLAQCTFAFGGQDCAPHAEDVEIDCTSSEWEFRFVRPLGESNTSTTGRIEMRPNASAAWGSVCARYVDYPTAVTLCSDAGFSVVGLTPTWASAASSVAGVPAALASQPIWLAPRCDTASISARQCDRLAEAACTHADDVVLTCFSPPPRANATWEYRIEGGATTGLLQVRPAADAPWGVVCRDSTFDPAAARVACQSAHRNVSFAASLLAAVEGPVWMRSVACANASFDDLSQCSFVYNSASCSAAVSLDCSGGDGWGIRLVDEFGEVNVVSGRLEVRPNATAPWGTVCDDGFSAVDAVTACITLGHNRARLSAAVISNTVVRLSTAVAAVTPIYMDDVACTTADDFLPFCDRAPIHNCGHAEDVAIQCSTVPVTPEWEYRLAQTATSIAGSGRLEVRPGPLAAWGTVCDDGFGPTEAAAACRGLGYSGDGALDDYSVPAGTGTIWMDDVNCRSAGSNPVGFAQCRYLYNSHNCGHSEDIGVICKVPPRDFRLFPTATPSRFRLMMRPNASVEYGGVCDPTFTTTDATAVCRALLPGSIAGSPVARIGGDAAPMWASSIYCSPAAGASLAACQVQIDHAGTACPVADGVGVECDSAASVTSWNASLLRSTTTSSGFALHQVLLARPGTGTLYEVCASGFDRRAAAAMCRAAGYPGSALVQQIVTPTTLPTLGARFECGDDTVGLGNCSATALSAPCTAVASVVCGIEWSFRLVDGSPSTQGLINVRPSPSQSWGTVCDDYFDEVDAWAACRSAGFSPLAVSIDKTPNSRGSGPIWLDNVQCAEGQRLEDCAFSFDDHNCGHSEDVYVDCAVLPGWLIAIIVLLSIAAFCILCFTLWWCCTREARAQRAREREFQDALDARVGPLDAAAQQALFDDDIPPELRAMADVPGLALVVDEQARPAAQFTAPELPTDPDLTAFHRVQLAMVLAARGDNAALVELNLEYVRRSTRGFSSGVLAGQARFEALAAFDAWDLAGGLVYPSTMVVASGRQCRNQRAKAEACDAARHPHVAQIMGICEVRGDDARAVAAAAGLAAVEHGRLRARTASVWALEAFPKHFSLQAQLDLLRGPLQMQLASTLLHRIIDGALHLEQCGFVPVVTLDTIVTRDGTLYGEPVITVFSPPTDPPHAPESDLRAVASRIAAAAQQHPPPANSTTIASLRPRYGPRHQPVAPSPARRLTPYQYAEDVDCAVRLQLECAMCGVVVHSSGYHLHGVDCSDVAQHFMCCECVNVRISALLTDDAVDMAELPCPMGCGGVWSFDDFGALVSPQLLRKWQQRSVERTRTQALEAAKEILEKVQQDAESESSDPDLLAVREHVAAIRKMLRPACPNCGMAFESFSGCLSVTCGAKDANGRQVSGCGSVFCGGCMTKRPCPKNCGHAFVQPGELHRLWRVWRMQRPTEYLREHFSGGSKDRNRDRAHHDAVLARVLRGARSDLEVVGVWPLPGFNL